MNRRTIAILIFVVGILMLSIVGILFVTQQDQPQSPAPETDVTTEPGAEGTPDGTTPDGGIDISADATLPAMIEVVVSLQTVGRGYQMTEAELTTDMRLAETVADNVITSIDEAVGLYARTDIFQGETITRDMLVSDPTVAGREDYGPSSLIPFGYVAAAVPMDRLSGVAYALSEGDAIDILISFTFVELDEQFQTLLENSATFYLTDEEGNIVIFSIDPFGRLEALPTGDTTHIAPSEPGRPTHVSMLLQNARVIQVGTWVEALPPQLPTPTPEPVPEGEATPTPAAGEVPPTATPAPDVLLVALPPQQQLLLKYALEANADVDFALRRANDGQLYSVENVDLNYLLGRFGIDLPPRLNYSVDPAVAVTPTPEPTPTGGATDGSNQ